MLELADNKECASHQNDTTLRKENKELRADRLQKDERIQSLLKHIEELEQNQTSRQSQDDECHVKDASNDKVELQESSLDEEQTCKMIHQSEDDEYQVEGAGAEDEKIKPQESPLLDREDQSFKMDLLAKVASLETQIKDQRNILQSKESQMASLESQIKDQRNLLQSKDSQIASLETQVKDQRDLLLDNESEINAQARTIMRQDNKLLQNQDVIQEQQIEITSLDRKSKGLEGVLLRMEIKVKESQRLQEEHLDELTKLQAFVEKKDDRLNANALEMKYLSDLCCQAQDAMHEDKATIANLEYDIDDLVTTVDDLKEDLEECKQSLFTANQIITLTGRRDSRLKSHVCRLTSYYRNKENGSCFPFKMFGARRQQSPAVDIVSKLAQVLFSEED